MARKDELLKIFNEIDEAKRELIKPLLNDVIYLEDQLEKLRALPKIRIHPKNPERQEVTPAGKLYKEYMQSYLNAIKTLQTLLFRENETGESQLVKALKDFENSDEDYSEEE